MLRAAFVAACIVAFLSGTAAASPFTNTRFDADIRKATKLYLPHTDWKLWKAQLIAESKLDPNARSPVGAEGIAQFMPATWREVLPEIGRDPKAVPRTVASVAIEAGAYYMAKLVKQAGRFGIGEGMERYWHAVAGYNAGLGHILKAWRLCDKPPAWDQTVECLGQVTGRHERETRGYVVTIRRNHRRLIVGA